MGWTCGQLWQYAQWYWDDANVASCRKSEAANVCRQIFDVQSSGCASEDHSTSISQTNAGVNLFEVNLFGESHGVSHAGFFIFLTFVLVVVVLLLVVRALFRKWAVRHQPAAPEEPVHRGELIPLGSSTVRGGPDRAQPVVIQLTASDLFSALGRPGVRPGRSDRLAEADDALRSPGEERETAEALSRSSAALRRVVDTPTL